MPVMSEWGIQSRTS